MRTALLWSLAILLLACGTPSSAVHNPSETHILDEAVTSSFNEYTHPCLDKPESASCSDYVLPQEVVDADNDDLCSSMPFMVACSVKAACQAQGSLEGACHPFSVLADTCSADIGMQRMRGCSHYNRMCNSTSSTIRECALHPAVAGLPPTSVVNKQVGSICDEMPMEGCDKCPAPAQPGGFRQCDLLAIYAALCQQMSDMYQCARWQALCSASGRLLPSFCPSNSDPGSKPPMRMYFHTGTKEYILFESWVPRSRSEFAFAVLLVFLSGMFFESLPHIRSFFEARWGTDARWGSDADVTKRRHMGLFAKLVVRVSRSAFRLLEAVVAYLLMLVAMTFNVPLFLAVVCGIAFGNFVFGSPPKSALAASRGICCD
mmetsp:Transcript_21227/g.36459  ORF Transcript_21227/g.36459 Transcript_21227/m.36459 type:complete len:374 (+) Transcript_21227:111-1232(+)|eukprot:CAMPEP_0196661268 /NCGR_PEP_ID=MMETSP1086-20130531/43474_1 /TAXON_ID=77921 /ORGANISM="Cyanoptyche  gloeocystis , Strain SAG4.97" /LENGTH=373 /DNA_ID=CAMNT_0041996079 /DNA_START=104 /DNA_END=1225 /DNA_ORIENTATION=+